MFWLSESSELQKSKEHSLALRYISKLDVHVKQFDDTTKKRLEDLQKELSHHSDIEHVDSMFAKFYLYNDGESYESSLIKSICLCKLDAKSLREFVKKFPKPYEQFVDSDFKTFSYIIYSLQPLDIKTVDVGFAYTYIKPSSKSGHIDYIFYTLAFIIFLVLLFYTLFRNFISSIAALFIISFTLIFSFELIYLLLGVKELHVAMTLIIVSIALVDYLYFYFRWHVSQYKEDTNRALQKMLNRNLFPAFWTTTITLIGLGSMLFVDSKIVQVLSLSLISSSVVAYILNITLLPALLSYFRVKHPRVGFSKYCYMFADIELHYNKKYLIRFVAITTIILLIGSYRLLFTPEELFNDSSKSDFIELRVPYNTLDVEFIQKIGQFQKRLNAEFATLKSDSIYSSLEQLMEDENHNGLSEQQILEALFFIELYDIEHTFVDDNALIVKLHVDSKEKLKVIKFITNYEALELYMVDIDSLVSSSKIDKTLLFAISLSSSLLIIGLIMGGIFQNREMVLVAFIANAAPIAWFGLFTFVFDIALSLELLIAMTITVGLASDATVHFAFKYFRSRYYGRSLKQSLEKMFFYASIPVMIGTLLLASVFTLMTFTQVHTLVVIGGFAAILMLLSLLTDMLILPPLLMWIDKFANKIK